MVSFADAKKKAGQDLLDELKLYLEHPTMEGLNKIQRIEKTHPDLLNNPAVVKLRGQISERQAAFKHPANAPKKPAPKPAPVRRRP